MMSINKLDIGQGQTVSLMNRTGWDAHLHRRRYTMKTPVTHVRFTSTGTGSCQDNESCARLVKVIQETYIDTGFDDIPNNFLIGGDGVVYEGKGWTVQPELPNHFHHVTEDCIDIAYIGDYSSEDPPWKMISVGIDLLKLGLRMRIIDPVYKIIPLRKDSLDFDF